MISYEDLENSACLSILDLKNLEQEIDPGLMLDKKTLDYWSVNSSILRF